MLTQKEEHHCLQQQHNGETSELSQSMGLGESVKEVFNLPIPKIILGIHSTAPILDIRMTTEQLIEVEVIQGGIFHPNTCNDYWLQYLIHKKQSKEKQSKKNILSPLVLLFS